MARKKITPAEEPELLHPDGPEDVPSEMAGDSPFQEPAEEDHPASPEDSTAAPEETDRGSGEEAAEADGTEQGTPGEGESTPEGPDQPEPAPDFPAGDQPAEETPQGFTAPVENTGQEAEAEVVSVDLSEPAPAPDGGEDSPDLDSMLEDQEPPRPVVPLTVPLSAAVPAVPEEDESASVSVPEKSDRQRFFELKFNRLDRSLTPEERQEWNSIYASYRGRSALTGTIIGVDPFSVQVRNPETGMMEKQTMYCATVVPYRVRIVIPAAEMWEKDNERPDFVLQNMVGAAIDFIIIKVDREAGFAIGSRRLAARSQRYFFAHRPNLNAVGTRVKCRMLSVGPRRCLVECYGHDIGLTQRELRYTAIPDLRDEYHPGQELDCIVKAFDPGENRLVISVKETESNPYEGAEQRHPVGARRLAVIAGKYGGGVFCNLPDGTVCMCNYSYQHEDSDFLVGDHVMLIVQRFDPGKQQMYGKILTKW